MARRKVKEDVYAWSEPVNDGLAKADPKVITGLAAEQAIARLEQAAEQATAASNLVEVVKVAKRRGPSRAQRDSETNKVIRRGRNLSGNQPFARKFYYVDTPVDEHGDLTPEYQSALDVAPMQVRLILKYMRTSGLTSPRNSAQGGEIVQGAINAKVIATKIDPPTLFAYYRKVMERLGLRLGSIEGLDGEDEVMEDDDGED